MTFLTLDATKEPGFILDLLKNSLMKFSTGFNLDWKRNQNLASSLNNVASESLDQLTRGLRPLGGLLSSLSIRSIYPQQSQFATQPSAGMYGTSSNMNLAVMAASGGAAATSAAANHLSGQMGSMSSEQVRKHQPQAERQQPPASVADCQFLCRAATAALSWSSWQK